MVKKINQDKPEKSTKAVKPVVAGKAANAKASFGGKKAPADKLFGPKKAGGYGAKKQQEFDKPAGKTPAGKLTIKPAHKPAPAVRAKAIDRAEQAPVNANPTDEKLQKVLARAGIGSRREMERAIEQGLVKVNDRVAKLGDRVTPQDKIFVNGQRVVLRTELTRRRVILYNKPEGEICSRSDPEGRPTVYDHLPPLKGERWISVGRLDFNTSGLLLFTNDGELANKLMHPSSVIDREYLVRIQGEVTDEMREVLLRGVMLDDGIARFTDIVDGAGEGRNRWFYCVVMEGRNREVRRLWESQGVKVSRLKRVRYANIFIPSHVRVGQWIDLTDREIEDLCMTAGFDSSTYTQMKVPTRDEQAQRERHDKKLRAASAAPRRHKAPLRKRPPIVE
jgi:23S rRNA pseudouridine2605 synthase